VVAKLTAATQITHVIVQCKELVYAVSAMQGACVCSSDCKCSTDVCKEAVSQMS